MRNSCNVFVRTGDVLVVSSAKTRAGFEILTEPVYRVASDATDAVLGSAVLNALEAYRTGIETPGPDINTRPSPVLEAAGCKTWGQLDRNSHNVLIEVESNLVKAIPTRRTAGGASTHVNKLAITAEPVAEEIGKAVRTAASRCM